MPIDLFKELLIHNLNVNGLKASFYAYGLGYCRYLEYATAFKFIFFRLRERVLDLGCGHSILPSFLKARQPSSLVKMAKKDRRRVDDMLCDFVAKLEREGKSLGYIENYLKFMARLQRD